MIKIFRWKLEGWTNTATLTLPAFSPRESILARRESIQHFKTKFMSPSLSTPNTQYSASIQLRIEMKEDLRKKSLKIIFSELWISFVSVNGFVCELFRSARVSIEYSGQLPVNLFPAIIYTFQCDGVSKKCTEGFF